MQGNRGPGSCTNLGCWVHRGAGDPQKWPCIWGLVSLCRKELRELGATSQWEWLWAARDRQLGRGFQRRPLGASDLPDNSLGSLYLQNPPSQPAPTLWGRWPGRTGKLD